MPKVLAIDHGTVRIGLAISDEMELVASPFKTISASDEPEQTIARIVNDKHIGKIVVGMPYRMSGEKGSAAERVEIFATRLGKELQHTVPIEFVDERLSSVEANASMARAGITGKRERDEIVDQLAAVVILQEYLNQQRGPEGYLLPDASYELDWTDEPKRRRK